MLIDELLSYSKVSLDRLTALEEAEPDEAVDVAWQFVRRAGVDGSHVPTDVAHAVGLLLRRLLSDARIEAALGALWPELGEEGREIVVYVWGHAPHILSDSLVLRLIESSMLERRYRIDLLNGLMLTHASRSICKQTFLDLVQMTEAATPKPSSQEQLYLDRLRRDSDSALWR